MDKKQYNKEYWSKPEVKEKKKLDQRAAYGTEKVQKYEHGRRRTVKSRYMRSKYNAGVRKERIYSQLRRIHRTCNEKL